MSLLVRRGLTLAELMVAMVLLAIVSTGLYKALVTHQRAFQSQVQRSDLAQNIRAAAAILPQELRELDAADGDIIAMSSTSLTIRAYRQFGIICSAPVLGGALTARTYTVRSPLMSSTRALTTTDSVLIYYEGNPGVRSDDAWVLSSVTSTATAAITCPDGKAGIQITGNLTINAPQTNTAGYIPVGAPIRGFETVTYKLYNETDGNWYLGLQPGSGTTVPLIGPLTGNAGLTFVYLNSASAVTATRTGVAQIQIVLLAKTAQSLWQSSGTFAPAVDSVTLVATLRNNPRF